MSLSRAMTKNELAIWWKGWVGGFREAVREGPQPLTQAQVDEFRLRLGRTVNIPKWISGCVEKVLAELAEEEGDE
jgi:hypothetical protein